MTRAPSYCYDVTATSYEVREVTAPSYCYEVRGPSYYEVREVTTPSYCYEVRGPSVMTRAHGLEPRRQALEACALPLMRCSLVWVTSEQRV